MKIKGRRIINIENDEPVVLEVDEKDLSTFLIKKWAEKKPAAGTTVDFGHVLLDFIGGRSRYTLCHTEKFEILDGHSPKWLLIKKISQPAHIFFYYRSNGSIFTTIFPPEGIQINHDTGGLTCSDFDGQKKEIIPGSRYENLWPWALFGMDFLVSILTKGTKAIQILQEVLNKNETNSLTMLIRSPQPYRGLGFQIAEKLEKIKNLLD